MLPVIAHMFRMSRDPELVYGSNGLAICRAGMVASRKRGETEETLWLDATAFGKTAEMMHRVRKGQRLFVTGRLLTEQWTDRNGAKRSGTRLIVESFEFVERREEGAAQGYAPKASTGRVDVEYQDAEGNVTGRESVPTGGEAPATKQEALPEVDVDEDEIPF